MKRDPLLDKEFLSRLDQDRNRLIYVKLIALDYDENPIEEIFGRITSGSINVDGSSAVRRTCSLSLVANELDINQYYWGLKSKFKCFIGLENRIDSQYDDVIYFPMGTYIITSFSTSQALANYSISISGKDKMCLLNGDLGGVITAISVDFGQLSEQQKDGSIKKNKLLIKDIIREAVKEYAHEPIQNIIVNDLDEAALELIEYRGNEPLYLIIEGDTVENSNQTFDPDHIFYDIDGNPRKIGTLTDEELDHRIHLNFEEDANLTLRLYATPAKAAEARAAADAGEAFNDYYTICKAEIGDVVGYRITDLTYAGDLIESVGGSITSMLDKIKNMLGDYEYFYDLDGRFVWQRKKTYINVSWNNIVQNENDRIHGESASYTSAVTYSFENHNLISSFQNSPNLLNIKNDFSIWGQKKLASGTQVPIHLRYAIDSKPVMYRSYDGVLYATKEVPEEDLRVVDTVIESEEQIIELLKQYKKADVPVQLKDSPTQSPDEVGWWDVLDWGEYYKQLTGAYPSQSMSSYQTEFTHVDLAAMFGIENDAFYPNGYYRTKNWDPNTDCFLFDTINGYLGFAGHNPYCGHRYDEYFITKYDQYARQGYEFHAYIYKPSIPTAIITDLIRSEHVFQVRETPVIVDWRELIYQMASDYMKHGMTDETNYEKVRDDKVNMNDLLKGKYYIRKVLYEIATEWKAGRKFYKLNEDGTDYIEATDEVGPNTIFSNGDYFIRNIPERYTPAPIPKDPSTFDIHAQTYYTYVDFYYRLRTYNDKYFPNGVTGYEQYYTDIMSFWRDLYDPNYEGSWQVSGATKNQYYKNGTEFYWFKNQENYLYQDNVVYYMQDITGNWHAKKNVTEDDFYNYSFYYFLPTQGIDNIASNKDIIKVTDEVYDMTELIKNYIDQLQLNTMTGNNTQALKSTFRNDYNYILSLLKNNYEKIEDIDLEQFNQAYRQEYDLIRNDYSLTEEEKSALFTQLNNKYINKLALFYQESGHGINLLEYVDDDYKYYTSRVYYRNIQGEYYEAYQKDDNGNIIYDNVLQTVITNGEASQQYVNTPRQHPYAFWNKNIWIAPEKLVFWFDFLDTEGDLAKYSVKRIGDRPKAENNTDIKALYYRETPNVIFVNTDEERDNLRGTKPGYTFISINNKIDHLFRLSSQGQSCNDKLNNLLYQYTSAAENITINSIPIYYLQPNTRIYVTDKNSNINGEYIVSKIGYSLAYNGTMSISATKAIDRIY